MGLPRIEVTVDGVPCFVRSFKIERNEAALAHEFKIKASLWDQTYDMAKADETAVVGLQKIASDTA